MKKSLHPAYRVNTVASRTRPNPLNHRGPIFEVLETTRRNLDGIDYEFVNIVAHLPQPDGLWIQAHITVKRGNDATLVEAIDEVMALHASGQLALLGKEVRHA